MTPYRQAPEAEERSVVARPSPSLWGRSMVFLALGSSASLREYAIKNIYRARDPGTIANLARALTDERPVQRERAFAALGTCVYPWGILAGERKPARRVSSFGLDEELEALRAEWQEAAEEQLRAVAIEAGAAAWVDAAKEELAPRGRSWARVGAAFVFGRLAPPEEWTRLFEIVRREPPQVFLTGALLDAIGELGSREACRALVELATASHLDDILDRALPGAIARIGKWVVELLEPVMVAAGSTMGVPLRLRRAAELYALRNPGAFDAWLEHESRAARQLAQNITTTDPARHGSRPARTEHLLRILEHPESSGHRLDAARRLAELGHDSGVAALLAILKEEDCFARGAASESLARHEASGAADAIADALERADELTEARDHLRALASLHTVRAKARVERALASPTWIRCESEYDNEQFVASLRSCLRDMEARGIRADP